MSVYAAPSGLPAQLLAKLEASGLRLALAESITGGAISAELVSVPGASKVLLGSIVAYQTELKAGLLGVSPALLAQRGAVNAEVAAQMAGGVRAKLAAKAELDEDRVVGLSVTGVAGPDTQDGAPVGKVFVGVSGLIDGSPVEAVFEHDLSGERNQIRAAAVQAALADLAELL